MNSVQTKKRVVMLMSGGVDSSVAAALLKQQNYDVIGVYILGWTGTPEFPCSWQQEEADARAVAEQLGIPFHTLNLSAEYEKYVIDEFFAGYKRGVTPNPDILCNKEIKFKAVWQAVRQFEPDYIATGHYARIGASPSGESAIYKPKDSNKDQTYFLWGIDDAIIPSVLFPLGEYTKPQIRTLAKKLKLPTAAKKDSQGICFVGPLKVRQFLAEKFPPKPGVAYLENGEKIAEHQGAHFYTIGQRLGAGSVDWVGDVPPLYVIAKDVRNNILVVGPEKDTYANSFTLTDCNWLLPDADQFVETAKIRYRQEDVLVNLIKRKGGYFVQCSELVRAITPGQSAVFYAPAGLLLGGGIINSVERIDRILENCERNRKHSRAAN